jgi:ComF family protein
MRSYVSEVIQPEEFLKMTDEELGERINKGLFVDEAKIDGIFESDFKAEYMERAVYVCPFCGFSEFESHGNEAFCKKCGRKAFSEGVCLTCKRQMPEFTLGISPFVYEGLAASLINRFKNGERYLQNFFAEEMLKSLREKMADEEIKNCILLFVPMTKEKELKRGYNQAKELALLISKELGVALDEGIFIKTRETDEQKKLSSKERAANLKGSYRVCKRKAVKGKTVLLIDDIITTGSTGSECARVLKNAGAKDVIFLTAVSVADRR